jgi:hypothetical protein
MSVLWKIERIFNFQREKIWRNGYSLFGAYDNAGRRYVIDFWQNWVGCISGNDRLCWSAGSISRPESDLHIPIDLSGPGYLTITPSGKIIVACFLGNAIYDIDLMHKHASVFIDGHAMGMKGIGNCECDSEGNIWVNEVEGGRVWQFNTEGKHLQTIGTGQHDFQLESVPFEEAKFTLIFDLRLGPDGNVYVLDSKNLTVRKLDVRQRMVSTVVGNGLSGYSGDGGDAGDATLGCNPMERYGGPWSLSLDEAGNIYIGDTQNHVVRMVERSTNIISTIAGKHQAMPGLRNNPGETNPLNLNFPKICGMEYWNDRLFIPEWSGDLVILAKT